MLKSNLVVVPFIECHQTQTSKQSMDEKQHLIPSDRIVGIKDYHTAGREGLVGGHPSLDRSEEDLASWEQEEKDEFWTQEDEIDDSVTTLTWTCFSCLVLSVFLGDAGRGLVVPSLVPYIEEVFPFFLLIRCSSLLCILPRQTSLKHVVVQHGIHTFMNRC